jgi:acetyl esterase/lipase
VPKYRLAPEHPFPCALEDALQAYQVLMERGHDPERISIAGDSAGGGLTLATLLCIRDRGLPMPQCGVALSPWTDLTCSMPSIDANNHSDAMLSTKMIRVAAGVYLKDTDPLTPYASPLHGDFKGLPRLLLTADEGECLRDEVVAAADKAREAGVQVELILRSNLLHVWPIFVPYLPEARHDLKRIVSFIQ